MNTIPTKITKEEYDQSYFAINRNNGDHWLINNQMNPRLCLWVGQDHTSLMETEELLLLGQGSFEANYEFVVDGNGMEEEIVAITFNVEDSSNDLDLEELEKGKISWI